MKTSAPEFIRQYIVWTAVGTVLLASAGGPPTQDRDGDGWPDALEHFLGTNPLDRQSVFAIRELARLQGPLRTELRWPSVSGRSYRIEASGTLAATGWQTVATVTGTGGVMVHEVAEAAFPDAKFFRLVTEYDTALPPWVGTVEVPGSAVTSTGATMLRLLAWHPEGVDEVIFRRGGRVLGAGTLVGENCWELPWNADSADNGIESVIAEARRGNTITLSQAQPLEVAITLPPQPDYLAQNPDQFVLLDAQGNPRGGAPVRADAAGNLPPCEFRPAGFAVAGAPASFAIRLPAGARITGAAGSQVLEFASSRLVSGAEGPLVVDGVIQTSGARTLPLGAVTVAQLETLFGLPAGGGVPVKIAGHFPAAITGGTFSVAGFTAPQIRLDPGVLPFGEVLGSFNGLTMELGERGFVRLPLSGSYPLDQYGGPAATLTIGAQEPAWVQFGFDGSLSMSGRGSLVFQDGPSFEVGLTLDGPITGFEFRVGKLHARVSGAWLAPNLPPAESLNAGTAPDVPTLEAARLTLERKSLVFERFSTAFAAAVVQALPRPDLGGMPSPLDVLGLSKLAGAAGLDPNSPEVKAAMEHAARAAAASRKATEAARHWFSLERLRLGGLTPPGLDGQRSETRAALKSKLEKSTEPLSLAALREVLRIGVERWQVAQQTGAAFDHDGLQTSFELAITNALASHAASLGVTPGQTGAASSAMAARGRFVIYHELNELFSIWQAAQQLGLTISGDALLNELLAQSGLALEPKLRTALRTAELAVDEMAFLDAMAEYLFLHQLDQQGVFGTVAIPLLSVSSLSDRAGAMATAVAALPRPLRTVAKRFQEVKRLGEILAGIPNGVTYPAPPVQRAYDGLQDSINTAMSFLGGADRAELLAILRGGNAGTLIRDRMGFAAGSPAWEDAARISAVVDALAVKCLAEDDSGTAQHGVDSLLASAKAITSPADQERRKIYLLEAQKLVAVLRAIALNRVTPPPAADALLAGGIAVDELAGGMIYNDKSKEFSGWGSGQVRLPGMGASFTMSRISFSNGGEFELNCHGSVTLPPGANGIARFTVPERRPLKFTWQRPDRFSISGGGRLEANGMSFEAWATLDDPEYAFGASASGLNFDLANSLKVMVPVFPNAPNFAPAVRVDLLNYVSSMAGNLDTLRSDLNPPVFRKEGEMPDFSLGEDFGPFGWIEASVDQIIANHVVGAFGRDYDAALQSVARALNTLEGELVKRDTMGDCASAAARAEMGRTLDILARIEKAVDGDPTGPGMGLLAARAIQLREFLAPRIACVTAFREEDTEAVEAERLAFLLRYGPADQKVEGAVEDLAISLPQRLTKLGIDPATGQPIGGGPLPPRDSKRAILAMLVTIQLQKALSSAGLDGSVAGHPGSDFTTVMQNSRAALARSPWDILILEGRRLLAENLRIRTVVAQKGPPGKLLSSGDDVVKDARKLGLELREWLARMVEYDQALIFSGTPYPAGDVIHASGPDGPFLSVNAEVNAVVVPILASELDFSQPENYWPVLTKVRWEFGGSIAELDSRPLIEGFQRTNVPYGTAEGRKRPLVDLKNETWVWESVQPDGQTAGAAYTAWRRATLAARELDIGTGWLSSLQLPAFASQIQLEIENYLIAPNLPQAIHLARETRNLMISLRQAGLDGIVEDLKVPLGELDAAFKALVVARQAWWHLTEYTSIFVEGSREFADQTAGSLGRYFGSTAESSLGLGFQLIDDLAELLPVARPLDVALPGDLRIDDVFGEIRYNRSTGQLAGSFGGSLTFPEISTNFTLTSLTLDNAGHIALNASASGPLPELPGARLSGTIALAGQFGLGSAGQPPVILQAFEGAGSGTATLPDGETFSGSISYDSTTRVLELAATGSQLDISLGDHFVLLSGTAGLRFGGVGPGAYPNSGRFEFGGTFGMLRKSSPAVGQPLTIDHFHLSAVEAMARLDVTSNAITVTLPQGKLRLPECFSSPPVPPPNAPQPAEIAINTAQPPQIAFTLGPPDGNGFKSLDQVTFSGGVTFTNLGLALPDFEDVGARDLDGAFDFGNLSLTASGAIPAATAPKLTINTGFVFFPHPVDQTSIEIEAVNAVWKLDGFPAGTLGLATNVNLFDAGGFTLTVLGAPGAQTTGLEILAPTGGAVLPSLRVFGQLRVLFDNTLIMREVTEPALEGIPTGQFGALAGGQVVIHAPVGNALPQVDFALEDVGILGNFRIGGENGVRITGLTAGSPASIHLSGLGNLFNLADVPGRQFIVTLNGKIVQQGLPGFGLGDARFIFFSHTQPPRFVPGTLEYDGSSWELAQQAPVELRNATLRFINGELPLEQLLAPVNLEITSTFRIGLPTVAEPIIGGGADHVRVTFAADGTPQLQGLEGIELTLDPGLDFPPIEELGGSIYVTGFSNPANLLFAGRVGGSVNGYKMKFILAMRSTGPLGIAVDFNAGSAGIPLGPTGFLFTGAGGGISFLNTNADPADIKSYVREAEGRFEANPENPPPSATMAWSGFKEWRDTMLAQAPVFPPIGTGPVLPVVPPGNYPPNDPIGCPVNVPPPSANILGMPHPDQAAYPRRYVLKFSAIPETTLNKDIAKGGLGITPEFIQSLNLTGASLAVALAEHVRGIIESRAVPVPAILGAGAQQAAAGLFDEIELGFATAFGEAIGMLGSEATAEDIYDQIKLKAWAGVPVQDATMVVKGVFTHAAVSAFMNVEGQGMIGTTGSAGVGGKLNFLGIPVGRAGLFLSATDVNGNPNPQITGDAIFAIGPLNLGDGKLALSANGMMTGIAVTVGNIANLLAPAVRDEVLTAVNPEFAGMTLEQARDAIIAGVPLSAQPERLAAFHAAYMAQVLRRPQGTLPAGVLDQVAALADQVNPELVACGSFQMKFAGLPMSNEALGAQFRIRKTGWELLGRCTPAMIIGFGTPIAALTSGLDQASIGFSEAYPDFTGLFKAAVSGDLTNPESTLAFARTRVAQMLENTTAVGTYEIKPLGMNLARASARVIMPDLTLHPVVRNHDANPGNNWVRPEMRGLPSREALLLEAVRQNRLGDLFWKGSAGQLKDLMPESDLNDEALTRDYFPHGGFAMAAMLQIPRIFTSLPREPWQTMISEGKGPLERLEALRVIMRDYFGTMVQQGNFMAYVPLPNPPALFDANGNPLGSAFSLDPYDLVESLNTFDASGVYPGSLWDLHESFAFLNLNGQILDIPIGEVNLAAAAPDPVTGLPPRFTGSVNFPENSWAGFLFGPVNVNASVAGQARPARRVIEDALAELEDLDAQLGSNPSGAQVEQMVVKMREFVALDMPRVELSASLEYFDPPSSWLWPQGFAPQGAFTLSAYSPEFITELPADPTPLDHLKKEGGIAMQGSFKLSNLVTASGQFLLRPPAEGQLAPHVSATLTGQTLDLPFGIVGNATVSFDTSTSTFFSATGSLQGNLDLSAQLGWPVTVPAGASVNLTNHTATLTFTSGGVSATVTANYTSPLSPVFTFDGVLELDPFVTNVISIVPQNPDETKLRVTISSGGGTLTDAKVVIGGIFNQSANLPSLTLNQQLDFAPVFISAPFGASVAGFSASNLNFRVGRAGGVLSITDAQGSVSVAGLGGLAVGFTGNVFSNGNFSFTGTTSGSGSFTGMPVSAVSAGASMTFTNGGMSFNGTVSGGLLGTNLLPGVSTMANVALTLSTTAVTNVSGSVQVSAARLGGIEVRPSSGNFTLTLSSSGISVPAGQLYFTSWSSSTAIVSTPAFTVPALNAALPATLVDQSSTTTGTFAGFSLSGLTFQLRRTSNSPLTYQLANVAFNAPLPAGFTVANFSVSGGSFNGQTSAISLPVTSLPSLSLGRFAITNGSGTPALTSSGLSLPAPRFACADLGISNLSLPGAPLVVPDSGALTLNSITAGNLSPVFGSLGGFTLGGASFNISKSGSTMNLTSFAASLNVPGFTASAVNLSGTVPSSGAISFTGSGIPQLGAGSIAIKGAGGGAIASTLSSGGGLVFTAGSVDVANVFNAAANFASTVNLTVPASTVGNATFASFTASPNLRGFAFGASSISLERVSGAIRLNVTSGSLPLPAGPTLPIFNGTISSTGAVSFTSSLTNSDFYGFPITASFTMGNATTLWTAIMSDTNPRAWWRMEESGSTTILSNSSSYAPSHNGITDSTTTRPALQEPSGFQDGSGSGVSMRFDGVDDFYSVPDNANLEGGASMSVGCWFRVNQFTGGKSFHTLIAKGDDSWRIAQDGSNNYLSFDTNNTSGTLHSLKASTLAVNDGRWHHVIATFDGTTKCLYIDGVLRASATWSATIKDSTYPVGIGYNPQAANRNWNGWIDEAAFWNTALTPRQIQAMYERGNGLYLSLSGQVNLRGTGSPFDPAQSFRPSFTGSISSSGEFDLSSENNSATLLGFGFNDIDLVFERQLLPGSTATITGAATVNAFPGTPFSLAPRFTASFTRSGGNTVASLSAVNQTVSFGGYTPAAGGFDLGFSGNLGTNTPITFSDFRFGNSTIAGLGLPPLAGVIQTNGSFAISSVLSQSITLSNFTAPSCAVDFTDAGLYVVGSFSLQVTSGGFTRSFGSVTLGGTLNTNGSYAFTGSGNLQVGAYATDSIGLTFSSSTGRITASGTPNLNFGALDQPISGFFLAHNTFSGSMTKSFSLPAVSHLADHLDTTLSCTTTLSYSFSTGILSGSLSGTWGWQVKNFAPPGGYNPSGSFSVSGSIGDNGDFTVNNGTASGSYFFAPDWPNGSFIFAPPPGWVWSFWDSEAYSLW